MLMVYHFLNHQKLSFGQVSAPFVIGLDCGQDKLNDVNEFLTYFLKKMHTLQERSHYFPGVVENVTVT